MKEAHIDANYHQTKAFLQPVARRLRLAALFSTEGQILAEFRKSAAGSILIGFLGDEKLIILCELNSFIQISLAHRIQPH